MDKEKNFQPPPPTETESCDCCAILLKPALCTQISERDNYKRGCGGGKEIFVRSPRYQTLPSPFDKTACHTAQDRWRSSPSHGIAQSPASKRAFPRRQTSHHLQHEGWGLRWQCAVMLCLGHEGIRPPSRWCPTACPRSVLSWPHPTHSDPLRGQPARQQEHQQNLLCFLLLFIPLIEEPNFKQKKTRISSEFKVIWGGKSCSNSSNSNCQHLHLGLCHTRSGRPCRSNMVSFTNVSLHLRMSNKTSWHLTFSLSDASIKRDVRALLRWAWKNKRESMKVPSTEILQTFGASKFRWRAIAEPLVLV